MRSLRNQHMTKDKETLHRHVLGIFADSYELKYSNSLQSYRQSLGLNYLRSVGILNDGLFEPRKH